MKLLNMIDVFNKLFSKPPKNRKELIGYRLMNYITKEEIEQRKNKIIT